MVNAGLTRGDMRTERNIVTGWLHDATQEDWRQPIDAVAGKDGPVFIFLVSLYIALKMSTLARQTPSPSRRKMHKDLPSASMFEPSAVCTRTILRPIS